MIAFIKKTGAIALVFMRWGYDYKLKSAVYANSPPT